MVIITILEVLTTKQGIIFVIVWIINNSKLMNRKRNKNGLTECAQAYISYLREEGRYSTAHVYKNALFSFTKFCGTPTVAFEQVNRERLRRYGQHLNECGLKPNTVSTYMRMLRSIYNRGVEAGFTHFIPHLFRDVYTGIDIRQKKAISVNELHTLLYKTPPSKHLCRTQTIARLMFQFCGMPFADFARLKKSDLDHGVLRYNRIKTGTSISFQILDISRKAIDELHNDKLPENNQPDYLFNILRGDRKRKEEEEYKEYQSALRRFNNQLKSLSRALRLKSPVSSYTLRHSWATNAKYNGIPIEMISESLGHKSIKTTQIYLKSFGLEEKAEANKLNCYYVENYK